MPIKHTFPQPFSAEEQLGTQHNLLEVWQAVATQRIESQRDHNIDT
jgi:hypothetical protein